MDLKGSRNVSSCFNIDKYNLCIIWPNTCQKLSLEIREAQKLGLALVFFMESIMKWLITLLLVKTVFSADQNPDGKPWFHFNLKFWRNLTLLGNVVNNGVAINYYWEVVDRYALFCTFYFWKSECYDRNWTLLLAVRLFHYW